MPQELLRDVLRSGDASHRQRHWSVLPLTIAAHVALVGVVVIAPLAAVVSPPDIPSFTRDYVATVKPPDPPAVSRPQAASDSVPNLTETTTTPTSATDAATTEAVSAGGGLGVGIPGVEGAPGNLAGIGGAASGPGSSRRRRPRRQKSSESAGRFASRRRSRTSLPSIRSWPGAPPSKASW